MTDAPARRPRRQRGARESLASIVLAFESVIAFLGGLTVYGLQALPDPIEPWWGIVAGAAVGAAMIIVSGLVRHTWGIVLGWVLQGLVAVGGFFVPALFLVAAVFGGMYAYATIKGASLDRRNAQLAADNPNGE